MRFEFYMLWIFLWVLMISAFNKNDEYVTVTTSSGDVMGIKKMVMNKVIYSFLGIPFAQPPIGKLRFRNPEPVERWKSMYSATKLPKTCYQNLPEQHELNNPAWRVWTNNTEMSEDCLYLSIWTPNLDKKSNSMNGFNYNRNQDRINDKDKYLISTLVWIHGGGFTSGSSTLDIYNGEILARQMNVIVINIQYRLGPLGFLSFNNAEIPGNQGLMDQVMALKWIQENIANFGGDSKLITIFGANSGAVSASFHLLSPLTQNLFNQAIMQSGSALSWWAYDDAKTALKKALHFANITGCHSTKELIPDRDTNLYECLRSLDPVTLVVNQWKMLHERYREKLTKPILPFASYYFDIPFKPRIESPYLPRSPFYYLMENKSNILKKRVMLGTTKNEGLIHLFKGFRNYFMPSDDGLIQPPIFRYQPNTKDPLELLAHYLVDDKFVHHFNIEAIAFEYELPSRIFQQTDWKSQDIINVFDNIAGDYSFKCPVVDFADIYLNISQVYLYSFEQQTKHLPLPPWTGVLQGQEIAYIFGKPYDAEFNKKFYNFTEKEQQLSNKMMTFWTNFAQTGHPNNRMKEYYTRNREMYWEKYEGSKAHKDSRKYLVVRNNSFFTMRNFRRHECLFWRQYLPDMRSSLLANTKCPPRTNNMPKTVLTSTPVPNQNPAEQQRQTSEKDQKNPTNFYSQVIHNNSLLFLNILWVSQILYYLL